MDHRTAQSYHADLFIFSSFFTYILCLVKAMFNAHKQWQQLIVV